MGVFARIRVVKDKAAPAGWHTRHSAGQTSSVTHDEALRQLGLAG
jgi:hypothetical protein